MKTKTPRTHRYAKIYSRPPVRLTPSCSGNNRSQFELPASSRCLMVTTCADIQNAGNQLRIWDGDDEETNTHAACGCTSERRLLKHSLRYVINRRHTFISISVSRRALRRRRRQISSVCRPGRAKQNKLEIAASTPHCMDATEMDEWKVSTSVRQ